MSVGIYLNKHQATNFTQLNSVIFEVLYPEGVISSYRIFSIVVVLHQEWIDYICKKFYQHYYLFTNKPVAAYTPVYVMSYTKWGCRYLLVGPHTNKLEFRWDLNLLYCEPWLNVNVSFLENVNGSTSNMGNCVVLMNRT